MNVILHELKMQRKSFFFWCLGVSLLVLAGMTKYSGISNAQNVDINAIMNQFPRIVLAVLGILGLNANELDGYYAMMAFYSLICICIYASFLGFETIQRENLDKTQDFLFTKPISKRIILFQKTGANLSLLLFFCIVNFLSSILSTSLLSLKQNIFITILYFNVTMFFIGLLFFFCSTFLSVLLKDGQKGSAYGMYLFLGTFFLGIISQMTKQTKGLRILAPMRYYLPTDLLKHHISFPYLMFNLVLIFTLAIATFYLFDRKDLYAS